MKNKCQLPQSPKACQSEILLLGKIELKISRNIRYIRRERTQSVTEVTKQNVLHTYDKGPIIPVNQIAHKQESFHKMLVSSLSEIK